jgi:hypothetical protein
MGEMAHLQENLKRLGLHTIAAMIDREVDKAIKSQASYTAFLQRLVEEELAAKADRSINARIAKARFPALRTLEAFDFGFQPGVPVALVKELADWTSLTGRRTSAPWGHLGQARPTSSSPWPLRHARPGSGSSSFMPPPCWTTWWPARWTAP